MYLSKLQLSDFLCYRTAEVEFKTSGLVLIIGANNAGKSALLRALDVAAGAAEGGQWRRIGSADLARVSATFTLDDPDERAQILGRDAHPDWLERVAAVQVVWEDTTAGEMLLTGLSVELQDGLTRSIASVDYERGSQVLHGVARNLVFEQPPTEANWDFTQISSTSPASAASVAQISSALPGLGRRFAAWREWYFHFAPVRTGAPERMALHASPTLSPTGSNLPQALLHQQTRNSEAWSDINAIVNQIIPEAGAVQARAEGDVVELVLQDPITGVALNLKRLGTGVEQVLMAAYVGATMPAASMVVLEEPEAGLHPGAQRLLLDHLREWARSRILVVSTHSTVFLDHAVPDETRTHLVRKTRGVARLDTDVENDVEVLRSIGVRLSDVASAERVLLVEGDSDERILHAWFADFPDWKNVAVVSTGGGDKAWHAATVAHAASKTDRLGRRVVFLRDRDELDDHTVERLRASGVVHVLQKRELENYLFDSTAIAEVLVGATPDSVAAALEAGIEATRDVVQLKLTAEQLRNPIRLLDRSAIKKMVKARGGLQLLLETLSTLPSSQAVLTQARDLWIEVEQRLELDWRDNRASLAPGEEVLSAVWREHGRAYDKLRDGPKIAAAMQSSPEELKKLIVDFVGEGHGDAEAEH